MKITKKQFKTILELGKKLGDKNEDDTMYRVCNELEMLTLDWAELTYREARMLIRSFSKKVKQVGSVVIRLI